MVEQILNLNCNSKEKYRQKVLHEFLKEKPGTADEVSHYIYYVEELADGKRIFLKRPTSLNKGVDFEVRVEDTHFRYGKSGNIISTGNRPKHLEIYDDLIKKSEEDKNKYDKFFLLVRKIYNCEDISEKELQSIDIQFKNSYSSEMILKVLKWLFIEQDITYWNHSGRNMLFTKLSEI